MTTQYRHRIGVRAEICFDLTSEERNPSPEELCRLVTDILRRTADSDGGIKLNALSGGVVYPEWNSVDAELEPNSALLPSTIRIFDSVEIDKIQ